MHGYFESVDITQCKRNNAIIHVVLSCHANTTKKLFLDDNNAIVNAKLGVRKNPNKQWLNLPYFT